MRICAKRDSFQSSFHRYQYSFFLMGDMKYSTELKRVYRGYPGGMGDIIGDNRRIFNLWQVLRLWTELYDVNDIYLLSSDTGGK